MSSNTKKPYRGGPRSQKLSTAQEILNRTLNTRRLASKMKRFSLFVDWNELVGADVAAVAQPKKIFRGSTLLVEVVDPVWVQELSLQKTSLLETLNGACEGILLDDIQFVAGNPNNF